MHRRVMDLRKRRKHSNKTLPIGTVRLRREKRADGSRYQVRVIKVRQNARHGQKWIGYARWLWEREHGPVPAGMRVIHRDGDVLNDDLENLLLGTAADVVFIHCHADPEKSAENYRRCREATAEHNRESARIRRATSILPSKWYPVDLAGRSIINDPHRKRRSVLGGAGALNGQGWHGWMLGWPELGSADAFVCAVLADGRERDLKEIHAEVSALRERYDFAGIGSHGILDSTRRLAKGGYLHRCRRGTYLIARLAIERRGSMFAYVVVRGECLLKDERYAGFELKEGANGAAMPDKD